MSGKERRKKLIGPWQSLHGAVWLIGLAFLALTDWWWPGILLLVAASLVIEALLKQFAPQAFEKDEQVLAQSQPIAPPSSPSTPSSSSSMPSSSPATPSNPKHRLELLPSVCPSCGGPIRGHEVKWTGEQSADCPFCGMNLPMGTSR